LLLRTAARNEFEESIHGWAERAQHTLQAGPSIPFGLGPAHNAASRGPGARGVGFLHRVPVSGSPNTWGACVLRRIPAWGPPLRGARAFYVCWPAGSPVRGARALATSFLPGAAPACGARAYCGTHWSAGAPASAASAAAAQPAPILSAAQGLRPVGPWSGRGPPAQVQACCPAAHRHSALRRTGVAHCGAWA